MIQKETNIRIYVEVVTVINKITLENFKAFEHAEIEIKPITILVGPNNGGKTSLMQSISLIKQTLGRSGNEVLSFGGYIQNLGDFDTIIHQNATKKEIQLRFDFEEGTYFDIRVAKGVDGKSFVKDFSCNNKRFEYILKNIVRKKDTADEKSEVYEPGQFKLIPGYEYIKYEYLLKSFTPNFVRETFFFKIRSVITDKSMSEAILKLRKREYFPPLKKILGQKQEKEEAEKIEFWHYLDFYINLERASNDFYQTIKQKFENIQYIGPIRATAERSYVVGTSDHVGFKGEYAVQMLAKNSGLQGKTQNTLKKLEIANDLEIKEYPQSRNFEFKLKTDNTDFGVNFADLGCGTSQILPLIVQSIYSQDDSMVIIEQPEAHLHPKIQADFASFLVEIIKSKKIKFLIETHSEYFIERIRTSIMKNPNLAADVAIYYVEQNKDKKQSDIIKIEINHNGQYSALPDGYLINFRLKEIDSQMDLMLEKLEKEIGKE